MLFTRIVEKYILNPVTGLLILALLSGIGWTFYKHVDLVPQIKSDFFFAPESSIYKQNAKINSKFILSEAVIVSLPTKKIRDPQYVDYVRRLSNRFQKVPGVNLVQSITHGPDDLEAALKNPLWTRLLDTQSNHGSFILCFIEPDKVASVVQVLEKIKEQESSKNQPIHLSGIPFIIEQMRLMLSQDMKNFMLGVVAISVLVLLLIFQSFFVIFGSVITALASAAATLIIQQAIGVKIGVLTANLGAIIYVLTISHIVFMTANWRNDINEPRKLRLASTITTTLPASFWAMLTTLCGFVSLIFVEAQPLKQLGTGGSIGTLVAFVGAYFFYPLFLQFTRRRSIFAKFKTKKTSILPFPIWFGVGLSVVLLVAAGGVGWLGIKKLDTDPSLLSYFKKGTPIHSGIVQVDESGGSNPLNFVVSHRGGKKLKNDETYKLLLELQEDIENHPAVGSVLSLAILMKETQQSWYVRLLPWGSILNRLSSEQYDKVARGFITEDFNQALFMIRMKENNRRLDRKRIINQLMARPRKHNMRLDLVGGTYYMQSELALKIRESMKQGILALLSLFAIVMLLLSFSITATLFASLAISGVVAGLLGTLGLLNIPIDIISSPSVNVCLGLAVDGMIHLILDARRNSTGSRFGMTDKGWRTAISRQSQPIFISALVIASGFSIFYLSQFPPSQRFGLEIVFGSLIAMAMTLTVLPHCALLFAKKSNDET